MELRQFLAFKEVVERGGFTRAANHLHLTQSAVSQQIKALEDELGTALLHRVCRQVRLTDAGQIFLSHAKQILEQVEDAQSDVAEVVGGMKGSCRVGCIPSIAPRILPHLILTFRQTFPDVMIQTKVGSESQLLSWLKEGSVDVCISGLPDDHEEVEHKVVMQETFVLVVPVEHHFAGRKTVKLEELLAEDLIMSPPENMISAWFTTTCEEVGFKPQIVFESADLGTRLGMVAAGLGISVESEYLISCSCSKGTVMVEVEFPALQREIGVIWRRNGHRLRSAENFLGVLNQVLQQSECSAMRSDSYSQDGEKFEEDLLANEMAVI